MNRARRISCFIGLLILLSVAHSALAVPRALPPETERQIRALLQSREFAASHLGLIVIATGTVPDASTFLSHHYSNNARPVLLNIDGDKRFLPASNMKLYTAALALHLLGPRWRAITRVEAVYSDVQNHTRASLRLIGDGDPSLDMADLRDLAVQVTAQGIRRVEEIIADGSQFTAEAFAGRYPDGWTLDDALWYYGPEVDALAFNRNQIDIYVQGGATPGAPAAVRLEPELPGFRLGDGIAATVTTGAPELKERDEDDLLNFERSNAEVVLGGALRINGAVAPGQKINQGAAVPNHDHWAGLAFAQAMREQGIEVSDNVLVGSTPTRGVEVAAHVSPPLSTLLKRLLKNSDNLYAEMLLRRSALNIQTGSYPNAAAKAHALLRQWLRSLHIPTEPLRFTDGSGLSRYDLVTPAATAQLLAALPVIPDGEAIWNALPIAGRDGTLKNRMRDTRAADNVRAKTGSFSIVSTLSGYVTTRDGHRLAVSLMTNFAPSTTIARRLQDRVFTLLSEASWAADNRGNAP